MPTTDPLQPPLNAELHDTWIRSQDDMVMVYVPGGKFLMGSAEGEPDAESNEFPQHEVGLDAFWLDRMEVSNAQYALCVADGDCDASIYAGNTNFNGANQPVVGVSWFDAEDYCAWTGGRLPTEAEWEYAARGPAGFRYPWGDTFDGNLVNYCDTNCQYDYRDEAIDDGYALTAPVGSYSPAGDSWVDAADMAGNVWEWVQDWYNSSYYALSPAENPSGPESGEFITQPEWSSGEYKVLRGGSWTSSATVGTASRYAGNALLDYETVHIGFRCVVSPSL